MAVALFFLSCQDDVTLLGYKNPNSKFKVNYVEIELDCDVYRMDSIPTSNSGGLPRVLVGKYEDPAVGTVSSRAFIELFHTADLVDTVQNDIVYDSVSLHIRFDYYAYGKSDASVQTFHVHQLTQPISDVDSVRAAGVFYSKKDDVPYLADPIGSASFSVHGELFKAQYDKAASEKDTTILKIKLDDSFGELLIARIRAGNLTLTDQEKFIDYVPGLAIVPAETNDKIVGFDHTNALDVKSNQSRVVLYYHRTGQTRVREATFPLYNQISYSNIVANFTGDLSAITDFYKPIKPADYRYLQTGTGLTGRVDFANFFAFADTVGKIIINSAELAITGYETADPYYPINNFGLYVMDDDVDSMKYKEYRVANPADVAINNSYNGYLTSDRGPQFDGLLVPMGDNGSPMSLKRNGAAFSSYMTLLAQQLYLHEPQERYRFYGLYPNDPPLGKTVNRLIFNKENLKLKIYYTTPTVNQ